MVRNEELLEQWCVLDHFPASALGRYGTMTTRLEHIWAAVWAKHRLGTA